MAFAVVLGIGLIVALAVLDQAREANVALDEFADEQALMARAIAAAVSVQTEGASNDSVLEAAAPLAALESSGMHVVLVGKPGGHLHGTDGRNVDPGILRGAIDRGETSVRLQPQDAARLGLKPRTAFAGLAGIDVRGERIVVISVATAEKERDRAQRARSRLLLGVLVAGGLVAGFGMLALRAQRRELELERDLEETGAALERDEALERAARAATLGTLAMGIAHEVTTPLSVIAGRAAQIAARGDLDARTSTSARAIMEEASRIEAVVRSFLDVARGDQPPASLLLPGDVVKDAVALVAHRFASAKVNLIEDLAPDLPPIHAHAHLLAHAVVNLLLNSCDACGAGGVVEVRARCEGSQVVFEVDDDGAGIDDGDRENVLRPFFSTKPPREGSGLGLPIAREIIVAHRGELSLEPRTSGGTRATIRLPVAEVAS